MLGFAIIGAGGIGKHLAGQLRQIESLPIALRGFYDENSDAANAAAQQLECQAYPSLNALLHDEAVQAVIIATPPFTHAMLTLQALAHGKHVFCEKPMALRLEDCDAMLQAAQKANRLLMVGHVLRLFPLFWHTKCLIEEGRIGRVLALNVRRTGYDLGFFSRGWRAAEEQGGGLILEMNVHELDYMRFLGGEVRRVFAQGIHPLPQTRFIQHWQALLTFETGAMGALEASLIDPLGRYTVCIVGEQGSILHGGFSGELVLRTTEGVEEHFTPEQLNLPDPYRWELTAFARAILEGEPLPFDGWDGRQAVALARACLQSIQTGAPVTV
jgi:UDP-N-acetylglucosamine 3-dehydrogenase